MVVGVAGNRFSVVNEVETRYRGTGGQQSEYREWAAQNLAVVLAERGRPQDLQEATQFLDSVKSDSQSTSQFDRLRAKVLAGSPSKAARQRAVQILERLV